MMTTLPIEENFIDEQVKADLLRILNK